MTVEELRAVEDFLEDAASWGMSLHEARDWVSARILGSELRALRPDLTLAEVEQEAIDYFLEAKT